MVKKASPPQAGSTLGAFKKPLTVGQLTAAAAAAAAPLTPAATTTTATSQSTKNRLIRRIITQQQQQQQRADQKTTTTSPSTSGGEQRHSAAVNYFLSECNEYDEEMRLNEIDNLDAVLNETQNKLSTSVDKDGYWCFKRKEGCKYLAVSYSNSLINVYFA